MYVHNLKSYRLFFEQTIRHEKTTEIRKVDDRLGVEGSEDTNKPFLVGDEVLFHEFDIGTEAYTGRIIGSVITWVSVENAHWHTDLDVFSFRLVR